MFEQVQVYLNNVPVENTNKTYPHRAYLENLLCYGDEAKKSFLMTNGFKMDKATYFDSVSADKKMMIILILKKCQVIKVLWNVEKF